MALSRVFLRSRWIAPLLTFIASRGLAHVAARAQGVDPWSASAWARWDSAHYLGIARLGYEFISCKSIGYPPGLTDACGNAGWFPGFPWLMRAMSWSGLSVEVAAAVLPPLFFLACLAVIWNAFLKPRGEASARDLLVLLAAALFPGNVYFHAAFPISLTAFCLLLLCTFAQQRSRPAAAGAAISAFGAALSYSTGFVAGGAALLACAFDRRWRLGRPMRVAAASAAGLGLVIFEQWRETGVWGAFFKVQGKYGYGSGKPFETLYRNLASAGPSIAQSAPRWPEIQTLIISIFAVGCIAHFALSREARRSPLLRMSLALLLAYWLFPHSLGGMTSSYRGEALLLPAVIFLRRAPVPLAAACVAVFALVAFMIDQLFFASIIV